MLKSIEEVYWIIDEVVKFGIKSNKKGRKNKLTMSEMITILIMGHQRNFSTSKQLYMMLTGELRSCFKKIPCYVQFTRGIRQVMPYLDLVIEVLTQINADKKQQFCIVDSTSLPVSGYNRKYVKWAFSTAGKGKNMHGEYQGFKLHIIVNQDREIVSVLTTPANVHDIQSLKDHSFIQHIRGLLIGDKGYIASLQHRKSLQKQGITLLAKQRKNMDPYLNDYYKHFFKKRGRIESIFSYLKTRLAIIQPFARTADGFLAHVKSAVIAYILQKFSPEFLCA